MEWGTGRKAVKICKTRPRVLVLNQQQGYGQKGKKNTCAKEDTGRHIRVFFGRGKKTRGRKR